MFHQLETYLEEFRSCFTRTATFKWFVVIVVGFMMRSDTLGITSVLRDLYLDGCHYESMLNFFYSDAWSLDGLRAMWYRIVNQSGFVYRYKGRAILVGDGVKQSKEARFMPCVNRMVQEPENSLSLIHI